MLIPPRYAMKGGLCCFIINILSVEVIFYKQLFILKFHVRSPDTDKNVYKDCHEGHKDKSMLHKDISRENIRE